MASGPRRDAPVFYVDTTKKNSEKGVDVDTELEGERWRRRRGGEGR